MNDAHVRAMRIWLGLTVLALLWALVVDLSGGFFLELGGIRLSSRKPDAALWLAAAALAVAFYVAPPGRRVRGISNVFFELYGRFANPLSRSWIALALAGVLACTVVAAGMLHGARAAGGSDAYGYVSLAQLFAHGRLTQDEPLMSVLPWTYAREALTPLGYRPAPEGNALLPTYSPGFPLTMALAQALFGANAVYDVVPMLGGLAVLATFLVGRHIGGSPVGLAAALLLATSPVFLHQLMAAPMGDVPVTAWWMLAFALVIRRGRWSALAAGAAAGIAVATRPNLLPLLLPIVAICVSGARENPRDAVVRSGLLVLGAAPSGLIVAFLNNYWWGSPFLSGYGGFFDNYTWANAGPNIRLYFTWLIESQTPAILLACFSPIVLLASHTAGSRVVTIGVSGLAFVVLTLACYVFYLQFDVWWYLRFLLPAFPLLLIFQSHVTWAFARRVAPRVAGGVLAVLTLYLAAHGLSFAKAHWAFDLGRDEQRYQAVGEIISRDLPSNAVLFAMQHSGSVRHYSGRPTIRYDVVPPDELDRALADLARLGYYPFLVLEEWEEAMFKARFASSSTIGKLDWPPSAEWTVPCCTRIYDPADRTER